MKTTPSHTLLNPRSILSLPRLTLALAMLGGGWGQLAAAPAEESAGSSARAPVSAEPTSFKQVAAHLDAGGNFYLYLSTEQWLTGLGDKISGFRQFFLSLPDAGRDAAKVNQVFDVITGVVKHSGVEEVSGFGLSSIALEKGFYRNRSILHHYPGKNTGYLWSLFGQGPHELAGLALLPQSTALASFGDMDLTLLWKALRQETSGIKEAADFFQQAPGLFETVVGVKLDDVLASLGNQYGLVLTLDLERKVNLPLPPAGLQIPEPGLLLAIKVKNDLLFNRLDELLKQQPNLSPQLVSVDKEGLKMRTLQAPLPVPFPLRPTLARSGDYLFVATSDALVQEVLAVKSGDRKGFAATDEFKRLSQGLPQQGNQFGLVSQRLGETVADLQATVLKANPMMNPASITALQSLFGGGRVAGAFTVSGVTDEGWVSAGNGSQDARAAVLLPLAVVPGLMAAIAIPNYVRARAQAQINTCIANLKQLDGAKESWALENRKRLGDSVQMSDLVPNYIKTEPRCPVDGRPYILNRIGTSPACPNYNPNHPDLRVHKLGAP